MRESDSYPEHHPDCFRQHIILVDPKGPISLIPSFRKRWDCPGCVSRKLWDGLRHLAGEDLRTAWEENRTIQREALRLATGYCAISFKEQSKRLIISTSILYPCEPEQEFGVILRSCIKMGIESKTISRLSFNALWTPPKPERRFLTIPTFSKVRTEVIKAIVNAGFPDMDTEGTPVEAVERRIKIRLNGEDLDFN